MKKPQQESTIGSYDFDNFYVVGASFMPTIDWVNPLLTASAIAQRVRDQLRERFGR